MTEFTAENELLSEAYANAGKDKKSLYLDSLLAPMSYAKAHFGTVRDCSGIKELKKHDVGHPTLSLGTFTHF